jgi:pyrroline-5-carboxylate reductase
MSVSTRERIAFIGGGNMTEALIRGLCDSGVAPRRVSVAEPRAEQRRYLAKRYRVAVHADNAKAVEGATMIVLAVKPQMMGDVLGELKPWVGKRQLVVSIAAGITLATIEKWLGGGVRVVRVMPNTPCLLGAGMSVLAAGRAASRSDLSRARALFETVGLVDVAKHEKWMDAVTGLSGSGPAYVYRFAEALIDGGMRAGLPEKVCQRLVFQTLAGAAQMLASTGKSPRELREAVSSPGGTTLAGLQRMEKGKFFETVGDGVVAAADRSRELARGSH